MKQSVAKLQLSYEPRNLISYPVDHQGLDEDLRFREAH